MAVRRDVWRELDGLPEHFFLYCEDVDMSHRLRLAGHAFGVLPAARIGHDYVFDKGTYKWRLLERNRWAMIVRTYPGPLLWLVLPLLLACELPLLAVAVVGGWAPAKLRAWFDVLAWLPRARRERSAIQAGARVSPRTFADGLTAQLQSAHFGAVGRSRWLSVALRAYWGVVLRVLARRP
jgi:GT2 family glycosyltransferase